MTLSNSDKERLADLLEKNRGGGRGGYSPRQLDPVTDESVVLVRRGEWGSDAKYHKFSDGTPACRVESDSGYRTATIEQADAHRDYCRYCWPEEAPDVATPPSDSDSPDGGVEA